MRAFQAGRILYSAEPLEPVHLYSMQQAITEEIFSDVPHRYTPCEIARQRRIPTPSTTARTRSVVPPQCKFNRCVGDECGVGAVDPTVNCIVGKLTVDQTPVQQSDENAPQRFAGSPAPPKAFAKPVAVERDETPCLWMKYGATAACCRAEQGAAAVLGENSEEREYRRLTGPGPAGQPPEQPPPTRPWGYV